ncbi:hypothetical protein OsI_32909 [Oryza sativa Indica Group]|uniref:Uncharacterized protein n=1 Tax=Oryza sativa subsp. indica TaxID=39946 RepID=B8BFZ3_ORYSI|nr:hypothetical protein OsI_32909 [Oryza sativa Indica Group]
MSTADPDLDGSIPTSNASSMTIPPPSSDPHRQARHHRGTVSKKCHECPARAITGLVNEAFRLLRPGGTIALTDNSPKSKVLQELSPVLFTLMKSTEPFLDEYYMLDLEETMRQAGFVNVHSILTDPRHRTVTATVPF